MSEGTYFLSKGSHPAFNGKRCAMEWVAYLAGEPHSDQPRCVSAVLNSYCVRLNDNMDDEDRQKLRPYLARSIGTAGDGLDPQRGLMCLDWLIRTYTPAWLELAGLTEDARALRDLPEIVNMETASNAAGPLWTARIAARDVCIVGDAASDAAGDATRVTGIAARGVAQNAAGDAADAAAWDAAWDIAEAVARAAAWAAAWAVARNVAGAAAQNAMGAATCNVGAAVARAVAWDAAWTAASRALKPTVRELQASAVDLLDRMLPKVTLELPDEVTARVAELEANIA